MRRDAFDGLSLMEKAVSGNFDTHLPPNAGRGAAPRSVNGRRVLGQATHADLRPIDLEETRLRRQELADGVPVPAPPFWGPRAIERMSVDALVPFLNERMLYQFQWGYRKSGRSLAEYMDWARRELRPLLKRMLDLVKEQDILVPQAAYGYWPASAEGNDVILYHHQDREREIARFTLPRQVPTACASPARRRATERASEVRARGSPRTAQVADGLPGRGAGRSRTGRPLRRPVLQQGFSRYSFGWPQAGGPGRARLLGRRSCPTVASRSRPARCPAPPASKIFSLTEIY